MSLSPDPDTSPGTATDTDCYECAHCGGPRRPATSVKGSFCSMRCYDIHQRRKQARDILNQIRFDHRFCATCFRQLKHVERPPAEMWGVPDCVIGFEYGTEHAQSGEKTRSVDAYGHERLVAHGIVCRCGNGHHAQAESAMQTRFAYEYLPALSAAVDELHAEGKTDATVDVDALDAALTAHVLPVEDAPDTVDWEIVLAAALND